jgi:hypothetical protein
MFFYWAQEYIPQTIRLWLEGWRTNKRGENGGYIRASSELGGWIHITNSYVLVRRLVHKKMRRKVNMHPCFTVIGRKDRYHKQSGGNKKVGVKINALENKDTLELHHQST